MKRAGSQSSAADSRRAADRLREATDALGHAQQQDAAGRLNSMPRRPSSWRNQQKAQADRVRDLIAQTERGSRRGQAPAQSFGAGNRQDINDRQKVTRRFRPPYHSASRRGARNWRPTQPGLPAS